MSATKYEAQITAIGPLVDEFRDSGILVLFREGAPEELAEFSILHDGQELRAPVAPGDEIVLGDARFRVLAVGDVASANLASLGHLVMKFNDQTAPEMPGDVCLEARPIPPVAVGMSLKILGAAA
ncbi:MAG: PTS glucitol/sorbitol transporter subunit IIA [Anaerolineae bacterium]